MFRRFQVFLLCAVLVVAAFSTGLDYLFYLVYLVMIVAGGSYVLTRLGLADLEAGYAVDRLNGHVGEQLRVTYTVRHTGRIPKPWLEVHNPTNLPSGLPGRAISLGPRAERPSGAARSGRVRPPAPRRTSCRRQRSSPPTCRVRATCRPSITGSPNTRGRASTSPTPTS